MDEEIDRGPALASALGREMTKSWAMPENKKTVKEEAMVPSRPARGRKMKSKTKSRKAKFQRRSEVAEGGSEDGGFHDRFGGNAAGAEGQ